MAAAGADPTTGTALGSAVDWVAGVLLGQAATSVAIVAVASLGFLMLSGRLPLRRGASAVLGCFILFSAGGIASGLVGATGRLEGDGTVTAAAPIPAYVPSLPEAEPYDPYSGAAVPDQDGGDLLE